MPVRMPVAEQDSVGPYNRMSASQANTYEACPRLWFYQKVYRFKMPQIPVLFVGRAVEEAVCRVLRESPGFVVASSSPEALEASPYKDDGTPISAAERSWPASGLMPLFPNERPQSLDDLEAWALQRGRHHLPPALERMRTLWENDERRSGDWAEVDQERCLEMVLNALRFHL
ncbi:MAG: PD-(D/E)XK nuclease family protein, partial [Candidatus Thermoplasmatota archaeon]|nr:PD-(D/E)XK nuclease family protein [Candidatus Thermoplasmatota archaeon]